MRVISEQEADSTEAEQAVARQTNHFKCVQVIFVNPRHKHEIMILSAVWPTPDVGSDAVVVCYFKRGQGKRDLYKNSVRRDSIMYT